MLLGTVLILCLLGPYSGQQIRTEVRPTGTYPPPSLPCTICSLSSVSSLAYRTLLLLPSPLLAYPSCSCSPSFSSSLPYSSVTISDRKNLPYCPFTRSPPISASFSDRVSPRYQHHPLLHGLSWNSSSYSSTLHPGSALPSSYTGHVPLAAILLLLSIRYLMLSYCRPVVLIPSSPPPSG